MTDSGLVRYEKRRSVGLMTLNRRDKLNAVSQSMLREICSFLDEVAEDKSVRALVITGSGRAFSAGTDLQELGERLRDPNGMDGYMSEVTDHVQEFTRRLVHLSIPTIAAINGVAVGIGAEIAVACDLRIGSDQCSLGFVEIRRGLFQTNGVMYFLPRIVGHGRAMELLLTGEQVPADEAYRLGLLNRLVPHSELMEASLDLADRLAANAPTSTRLVKQVMQRTYELDLEGVMRLEVEAANECLAGGDVLEGVLAFLESRAPTYASQNRAALDPASQEWTIG